MGQAFDRDGNLLGEAEGETRKEVLDKLEREFAQAAEIRIRQRLEELKTHIDKIEWQPTETAPRDGTLVLGWNGEFRLMWFVDMGRGAQWANAATAYEFKIDKQPTHWMPLPNPPIGRLKALQG